MTPNEAFEKAKKAVSEITQDLSMPTQLGVFEKLSAWAVSEIEELEDAIDGLRDEEELDLEDDEDDDED